MASPRVCHLAAALGGCLSLTACATDHADEAAAVRPLFRADVGAVSGGVAPGPHAVWYVPRGPVRFVKIGVATWTPDPARRRAPAWFVRLTHHGRSDEPRALAAQGLGLPTPSRVQVTNVATGRMVTLRIDDTAPIDGAMLRLPDTTAAALGADPRQPLLVRLRYVEPVMAYEGHAPLRYAFRSPRRAPAAEPVQIAAAQPPSPSAVAAPVARTVAPARRPVPDLAHALRGARTAPSPAAEKTYRVQAGAFASRANAERAADALETAGITTIEPLQRGAQTLYRVVVAGPRTEDQAERLRARVARVGFPDAWVLRPL